MAGLWRLLVVVGVAFAVGRDIPTASAYEFDVRMRTTTQSMDMRAVRPLGTAQFYSRSRLTQTLALDIWDLFRKARLRKQRDTPRLPGPRVYFSSYLQLDHDFGGFTNGTLTWQGRRHDLVDLFPELEANLLNLDVLYAFLGADGLLSGRVDIRLGRQLDLESLDWFSMDGVRVRVRTPVPVTVEGFVGLRVRDSSTLASDTFEPDGTAAAECIEYVEGAVPGSGAWRPIDRALFPTNVPFRNDFDRCPVRESRMPTYGLALSSATTAPIWGRVMYRRSLSRTVGLIGASDRFAFEDVGYYPNELGQAPGWGINEERVAATVRAAWASADKYYQMVPYGAIRYSLLHGVVDEAHVGMRGQIGRHVIEGEAYYSFPTFDGDSIFNVFSSQPFWDTRMTYRLALGPMLRTYARSWVRRFGVEPSDAAEVEGVDARDYAGGGQIGAVAYLGRERSLRVDAFAEGGFGGRRVGSFSQAWWRWRQYAFGARLSVISFRDDVDATRRGTSVGSQLRLRYYRNRGVVLQVLGEFNSNRRYRRDLRIMGVADFAFRPET